MRIYTGTIIEGSKRASALGFPTINIAFDDADVSGVFVARAFVDETVLPGVAFADPVRGVLEAHLFDDSANRYGREARIELLEKLRDSKMFDSDDELKRAIAKDAAEARRYFSK
jgi:riboflavin kinase/FMN adenylyltransferase